MSTGKTIALTRQAFVDKVMSLLFNMPSRLFITFLPRSKCLLISRFQSPSAVVGHCKTMLTHSTKVTIKYFYLYVDHFEKTGGSDSKVSVYNAGDPVLIPGLGRYPGEGNRNPLQYSCLENPMDGGIW